MGADWAAVIVAVIGGAIGVTWKIGDEFKGLEKKLSERDEKLLSAIQQSNREIRITGNRVDKIEKEIDRLKWFLSQIAPDAFSRSFRRAEDWRFRDEREKTPRD